MNAEERKEIEIIFLQINKKILDIEKTIVVIISENKSLRKLLKRLYEQNYKLVKKVKRETEKEKH